jgi:hypothetical protein
MITEATFAYLADVFIIEEYRGLGLSKWLMDYYASDAGIVPDDTGNSALNSIKFGFTVKQC